MKSKKLKFSVDWIDQKILPMLHRYGLIPLRYSLAFIFILFGLLKIVGVSAANELVTKTVYWFDPSWFLPLLGVWEVIIGLCFLYVPLIRLGILLLIPQMIGTFLPLVLLPQVVYTTTPLSLTLEGQYILKNLIVISAALVIGGYVREKKAMSRK